MPIFRSQPFPRTAPQLTETASPLHLATVSRAYRRLLAHHPFLVFGLPFIVAIVAGSFVLTPATAIRYEKFDRKTHIVDREEALGQPRREGRKKGGFKDKDIREEYWKLAGQADKVDDWEPVRVKRMEGEMDGTF